MTTIIEARGLARLEPALEAVVSHILPEGVSPDTIGVRGGLGPVRILRDVRGAVPDQRLRHDSAEVAERLHRRGRTLPTAVRQSDGQHVPERLRLLDDMPGGFRHRERMPRCSWRSARC